ncbi:hypothetical protein KC723_03475 [Candidatus Kaiserbacteria bacterium]|nr:hypothetical protein [Candidatus Kaiserbacteria bacterium]
MTVKKKPTGFPAPAIIPCSIHTLPSAYVETREELSAHRDKNMGVSGRAFPHRQPGSNWF